MKREIQYIGRFVRKYLLMYIGGVLSLFVVDAVNAYVPQLTGNIIDGLTDGSLGMGGVWRLVLMILAMGVVIAIGRCLWRRFLFGGARRIERDIRGELFEHLERLSMHYFNTHKTGDLMAHFTNDLQAVRQLVGMTVITAFDASVMLVMVLWRMIAAVDLRLTLAAIIPLIVIIVGDAIYGKVMHKRFLARQEAFSELTDQVQETISGIRVIKAFVQERRELYAFAKVNAHAKEKNLSVVRLQALVMPMLDMIIGLSSLITLLYGGWLAISGEITVGQFVAFNSYIMMLVWPMMAAGECITQLSQGLASLGRIVNIIDEKPEIADLPELANVDGLHGAIDLCHLTFAYPDQPEVNVLTDVSLHVEPGETIAILGRTGSGKSTIPSLLTRLYDVQDGMLLMDGRPIRDIPLSTLRRDIACVPQDNFLFSDTIAGNIAFGSAKQELDAIQAAAKAACIHNNIMKFPDGYETLVGERGVTISGGQKQRTSIARALMKDAPILILDDSLSAVDTDTEQQILDNLKTIRKNCTTIIVAHRISTIQDADHILVLDEGRRAEYGTHKELLALGGIYANLYRKQQLENQIHAEGGEEHV